jgi:probable HAF family extracellular repeat protein
MFPPTAPWWSARLSTPQGSGVPFAGRLLVGCKTSARWAAIGAGLMVFPPTAPWWSAGLTTPQGRWRAFRWTENGGMQDLGTLGGNRSEAYGVSADGAVVVGWLPTTPQGFGVPFAGRRWAACKASARWAAVRAMLMLFPPTAPWWSATLTTPQGSGVPFAGRRWAACKTSARCRDTAVWSWAYGVSADGSVVVGRSYNAAGQWRAFRWTASGGMQDLGTLGGSESEAYGVSADGSVVVGGLKTPQGRIVPFAGRRRAAWKT